jgi:hypothetical protein
MSIRKAAEALVGALNGSDKDAIAKAKAELERELGKKGEKWFKKLFGKDPDDKVA